MKPVFHKYILYVVFLIVATPFFSEAQRSNGLAVEGKVNVQEGSAEGAIIKMIQDGRRMDDYGIGADGKYKVELNYNHKYELIFEHPGNFSQKIVVETTVPKSVLQSNPRFPPFPVNINLFTEIPGIDRSFSQKTVLKIYYSPNVDNFISELYYNDAQIKSLINQAVLQSKMIGKESDYLSKLTKAEIAELRKEYNELLDQAGKQYGNEEFLAALDGYKAASKIFPKEQFPKDRISEINDLLGLIMAASELDKALAERFTALIKEADLLFSQKKYADAKNSYNRALSIKPTDSYALAQIKKIVDLQKKQQSETKYNELIAQADNAFQQILYNEAKDKYNSALQLKPNEVYPKKRIEEIDGILADQAKNLKNQENYEKAMFQAELLFEKQFYEKSMASYQNALNFKPGDPAATQKIEEIRLIMKEITDKMQYDKLVKIADKLYKKKEYPDALTNYKEAFALFPDEKHPKQRIDEINKILELKQSFADLVFKADNQFIAENYDASKSLYQQALQIHSNDKHSLDRIREIDGILATQGVEANYKALITEADNSFDAKNYADSKDKYKAALALKPKEKYPKERINTINSILQQNAKIEKLYKQAITKADGLFNQKNYEKAKAAFAAAGEIKPEEKYPPEMISKIDGLVAEQERLKAEAEAEKARLAKEAAAAEAVRLAAIQTEKDKNYADAISKADKFFEVKDYENSRTSYRAALTIKPDESYPQQQIDKIGSLLAQLSAAQKAYEEAVSRGDKAFRNESFDDAKTAYTEAKQAKADEAYPDEMLTKIDSIVTTRARLAKEAAAAEAARLAAIQAEKDKNYADAISKADNLFEAKDYENSRTSYRAALTIKPDESYPQQQIDKIGSLLAQLSAAQKAYEEAVSLGDKAFRKESFDDAKTAYTEAKQAKSDEAYPDEMLTKIDSIVTTRARLAKEAAAAEAARLAAIQAEKDKNYADAISKADKFFDAKDYENSRTSYRAALTIKPDESYPKEKISEIDDLLAALAASKKEQELLDKKYADLIRQADQLFGNNDYIQAKTKYNSALELKPEEAYPAKRIAEIDGILEQQKVDEQYRAVIVAADGFFKTEEYLQAKTEYEKALAIKENEQYPKKRIDEIEKILAKERERILAEKAAAEDLQRRKEAIAQINSEIDSRNVESEAELDVLYNQFIQKADALFDSKQYNVSRAWYYQALNVKAKEPYPLERIAEINKLVGSLLLNQRDRDYQKFIDLADTAFRDNELAVARGWYNRALGVKSNETYPKNQIAEIQKKIAERMAGKAGQQFQEYKQKADKAFDAKNFNVARFLYKKALELRPGNEEVKAQLAEIEKQ